MATLPCQGLPDRPCPWLRCDVTVHNTIYDSFLCHNCELTRVKAEISKGAPTVAADSMISDGTCSEVKTRVQNNQPVATAAAAAVELTSSDQRIDMKPKQRAVATKDALKQGRQQPTKRKQNTASDTMDEMMRQCKAQSQQTTVDSTPWMPAGDVCASGDEDDVGAACPQCLLPSRGDRELKCDICLQHYGLIDPRANYRVIQRDRLNSRGGSLHFSI